MSPSFIDQDHAKSCLRPLYKDRLRHLRYGTERAGGILGAWGYINKCKTNRVVWHDDMIIAVW